MKRIVYASGGFLTDDSIADALMDYASVLAIVGSADVIKIPGLDDQGVVREMQLVIGPASQLLSVSTDEPTAEMDADEVAADLHQRARLRLPNALDVADTGGSQGDADARSTRG